MFIYSVIDHAFLRKYNINMKSKIFEKQDIELQFAFKNCSLVAYFEEDYVPEED